jgi:probable HAF family extracellular repeat protein
MRAHPLIWPLALVAPLFLYACDRSPIEAFPEAAMHGSAPHGATPRYVIVDLGPGYALDLNARGEAVVDRRQGFGTGDPGGRLYVWKDGAITEVGDPENHIVCCDATINNRGQVSINSYATGPRFAFPGPGFIWENGVFREIDVDGGYLWSLDDAGRAVGVFHDFAFVWFRGSMRLLPIPEGYIWSDAVGINNEGDIVGMLFDEEEYRTAFLWGRRGLRHLGTLGGPESRARRISERGEIVGWAQNAEGQRLAVVWNRGEIENLGTLPGYRSSEALDVNNKGQIVGAAWGPWGTGTPRRPVLWHEGEILDLGTPEGTDAGQANAINERGDIVGWAFAAGAERNARAVLWKRVGNPN